MVALVQGQGNGVSRQKQQQVINKENWCEGGQGGRMDGIGVQPDLCKKGKIETPDHPQCSDLGTLPYHLIREEKRLQRQSLRFTHLLPLHPAVSRTLVTQQAKN